MSLNGYFPKEEIENWKKIFHEFHGKLLVDDKTNRRKSFVYFNLYDLQQKPER